MDWFKKMLQKTLFLKWVVLVCLVYVVHMLIAPVNVGFV